MSTSPKVDVWMPLFYMEYEAATAHLTDTEDRAYRRLIVHYWHTGAALPDDDARLALIVHKSVRDWRKIRAAVLAFFALKAGVWTHKRVDRELKRARENKTFTVSRAKAAAQARWSKVKGKPDASSILESNASSNAHNLNPPIGELIESSPDRGREDPPLPRDGQSDFAQGDEWLTVEEVERRGLQGPGADALRRKAAAGVAQLGLKPLGGLANQADAQEGPRPCLGGLEATAESALESLGVGEDGRRQRSLGRLDS